jgi:hypothetical protein
MLTDYAIALLWRGLFMSASSSPDPLSVRWALILLAGLVVSVLVGMLTFLQVGSWPAGLLAGLGAGGMTMPVLHQIVGK